MCSTVLPLGAIELMLMMMGIEMMMMMDDEYGGFLVACTRLYKLLGPSIGPSVADFSEHATYGDRPC